jgi:isochorismate synthase EntC
MGATPERLLAIENGIAKAASLAGTRPVNSTGDWREKELEEQAIVTQSHKKHLCCGRFEQYSIITS